MRVMSEPVSIVVPRENVNDESATLVSWLVADGSAVEAGRAVAQVETSKAVVEIEAPAAGTLRHKAKEGQDVPIGEAIGFIGGAASVVPVSSPVERPSVSIAPASGNGPANHHALPLAPSVRRLVAEANVDPASVRGTGRGGRITKGDVLAHQAEAPTNGAEAPPPPRSTRFSPAARALLEQLGLDAKAFEGRGLIRTKDLLPPTEGPALVVPAPQAQPPSKPVAASGVATRSEKLSRAKRTEAKYLRSGLETTLASVVTVPCPTRGFRQAFGSDATPLITFEAARLLRKYPAFNAYHDDGEAVYYEEVNVGFAVDAGRGLKVPIVRGADRKGVAEIAAEMQDLVVAYLGDALPVEALSGGTFTLTDLSGEGVTAFHPLINRGQSAILGICAEVLPAGGGEGTFNLVLAFDHQLAEGRAAARFLGDLRDRLVMHEASTRQPAGEASARVEEVRCSRCQASASELGKDHPLIQTVRADGSTRLLCILCLEGWN
jgi:pyruvate/2-oxoglutarate dehydrogenase complex dihydrolipoamide acyltransferase (E2) component